MANGDELPSSGGSGQNLPEDQPGQKGLLPTGLQARTVGAHKIRAVWGNHSFGPARTSASSGGSTTDGDAGVDLSTDGTQGEHASGDIPTIASDYAGRQTLVWIACASGNSIGNHANTLQWGLISASDEDNNNIACFRPSKGDDTDGNVIVDDGGNETTAAMTYPTLDDWNLYVLVVDTSAGETRFYANKNPFTETADATVAATPAQILSPGAIIATPDSSSGDSGESINLRSAELTYIP